MEQFANIEFKISSRCSRCGECCVAVAVNDHGVAVRDTKDLSRTTLVFSHEEWRAFTEAVKQGQFAV